MEAWRPQLACFLSRVHSAALTSYDAKIILSHISVYYDLEEIRTSRTYATQETTRSNNE